MKIDEIVLVPSTYKYSRENYEGCPIHHMKFCRFSSQFIQACKEGRAVVGCVECKLTDATITVKQGKVKRKCDGNEKYELK